MATTPVGLILASFACMCAQTPPAPPEGRRVVPPQERPPGPPSPDELRRTPPETTEAFLRMHVDILQAELTHEDYAKLNAATSTAETAAQFREVAASGRTRLLYSFDGVIQSGVPLDFDQGEQIPMATSRSQQKGQSATSYSYEDLGCAISGTALWKPGAAEKLVELNWKVEISGIEASALEQAPALNAPTIWQFKHKFGTLARVGQEAAIYTLRQTPLPQEGAKFAKLIVLRMRFDPVDEKTPGAEGTDPNRSAVAPAPGP